MTFRYIFPANWRSRRVSAGSTASLCLLLLISQLTFTHPTCAVETLPQQRLRVIVETDAGGDPDDEQSLVRLLLYSNEWDLEGLIANRRHAREGENRNVERTGIGIVRRLVNAYGECHARLVEHDRQYPRPDEILARTVAGHEETSEGADLILRVVDADDPRPVWYLEWGSDRGVGAVNMKRALDRVLSERGPERYAAFKRKLRIVGYDQYGPHTHQIDPPFSLWVNTFEPPSEGRRWYHRFSSLTATAGGFDAKRDLLSGHGALGALYPMNTTHRQKEGDTMTFLYLAPTGMNDPYQPMWGSWAGRYGRHDKFPDREYYWANQADSWAGAADRDQTLARWAEHLQNDFRARLDWCVKPFADANHPPVVRMAGALHRRAVAGQEIVLDARESTDPDGQRLSFMWLHYPEPSGYVGPPIELADSDQPTARFTAPAVERPQDAHFIVVVTDDGDPPLTRYGRAIVSLSP